MVLAPDFVANLKDRLAAYLREKAEWALPIATPEFPEPPEGDCAFCHCEYRKTPNPMQNRKNPFLEVGRKGALGCLVCRNMQNWAMQGVDRDRMVNGCKFVNGEPQEPEFYEKYMLLWFLWLDRHRNPKLAIVKLSADIPGGFKTEVVMKDSHSLDAEENLGIFWPEWVYLREKGTKPDKKAIVTKTINNKKMRGVILGKEHGRPLNTWKLKEKHSQGVEYNKKLDSDGAVRGHEQIKELYDMLVGKMAVKLTQKDKDAPIFLAMKDSALTAGLSSGGAGPTGSLDQKTLKILLAGGRALLAAKQELNGYLAVDNEELIGPKRMKTSLEGLKKAMVPKFVDVYVVAGRFTSTMAGVDMTGMDLYEDMRIVHDKLAVCLALATALTRKVVDTSEIMDALEKATVMVSLPMITIGVVWGHSVWSAFNEGQYEVAVSRLSPSNSGLPKVLLEKISPDDAIKFQETFLVDAVIKLLRGSGMVDACAKFATEVVKLLPNMPESSCRCDLSRWVALALVKQASADELDKIEEIKDAYSKEAGDYQSKFARSMKVFDTGLLLMKQVDNELAAVKAESGLRLTLDKLTQDVGKVGALRGLCEDEVTIDSDQDAVLQNLQENLSKLQGVMTDRFKAASEVQLAAVSDFLENARASFMSAYGVRSIQTVIDKIFKPALPLLNEICNDASGTLKIDDQRQAAWQLASTHATMEALPDIADTVFPKFATAEQTNGFTTTCAAISVDTRCVIAGVSALLGNAPFDLCDPVLLKLVELLDDENDDKHAMLKNPDDNAKEFEAKVRAVISKRLNCYIFNDGVMAKFKTQAKQLWDLGPVCVERFLGTWIPGDVAVADNVVEVLSTFVSHYRGFVCPSPSILDDPEHRGVSIDAMAWAPLLARFKQQPTSGHHLVKNLPAVESDLSEDDRMNGLTSMMKHLEAAVYQGETLKQIMEFAESWSGISSDLHARMIDLVTQCKRAHDADKAGLRQSVVDFVARVALGADRSAQQVGLAALMSETAGEFYQKKDDVVAMCSAPLMRAIFAEMKWFYSAAVRDVRALCEGALGFDPAASNDAVQRAGLLAGSGTAVLAMWRPLRQGE
ncbi:unnamed protein product, partial [Prorocentrum cordatum]